MDAGIVPLAKVRDVVNQWREPDHECFRPRTSWSLYNAFTDVLNRYSPSRGKNLGELFTPSSVPALAS